MHSYRCNAIFKLIALKHKTLTMVSAKLHYGRSPQRQRLIFKKIFLMYLVPGSAFQFFMVAWHILFFCTGYCSNTTCFQSHVFVITTKLWFFSRLSNLGLSEGSLVADAQGGSRGEEVLQPWKCIFSRILVNICCRSKMRFSLLKVHVSEVSMYLSATNRSLK